MKFNLDWPVVFRACIYVGLAALPIIIATLGGLVKGDVKIVPFFWALMWTQALYQALLALRAFYDGTAQRSADAAKAQNGSTSVQTKSGS